MYILKMPHKLRHLNDLPTRPRSCRPKWNLNWINKPQHYNQQNLRTKLIVISLADGMDFFPRAIVHWEIGNLIAILPSPNILRPIRLTASTSCSGLRTRGGSIKSNNVMITRYDCWNFPNVYHNPAIIDLKLVTVRELKHNTCGYSGFYGFRNSYSISIDRPIFRSY